MKRAIALLLALMLSLSLCACGGGDSTPETTEASAVTTQAPTTEVTEPPTEPAVTLGLGETASTDIVEFTLDAAQLAIALSSVYDNTYCAPKDYNAEEDAKNPFVCAKGHTYATFTYTIRNLDRTSFKGKLPLVSAEYKGTTSNKQVDGAEYIKESEQWRTTGNNPVTPVYSWNFVLDVGEEKTFRSFIDVPAEADSLTDEFLLLVELPNSDGTTSVFTYSITGK